MSGSKTKIPDGVFRIADCRLQVKGRRWDYALSHAAAIDAHWEKRRLESPHMFNGVIHLIQNAHLSGNILEADFLVTDFKSYLYWREMGFCEAGVRDGFGSALIRSSEGHVILGRQRPGNVNNGQAYLPGGFIDPVDIRADGTIDMEGSIRREVGEETGLEGHDAPALPGYIVTSMGPYLSFAREIAVPYRADEIRRRILAHIAADPASELTDAVIVRSIADLDGAAAPVHPYAKMLLGWLFARPGPAQA